MRKLLCLSAAVMILAVVNSAHAGFITVTDTTSSTTLFSDDGFEDDTVGTNPNAPAIGSWVKPSQTTVGAQVINAASPGPFDGLNYLQMNRATGANTNTAQEEAAFVSALPTGETMNATFAFLYQSTGTSSVSFTLRGGASPLVTIYAEPDYGTANFYTLDGSGANQQISSLAVTPGQWQTIGIGYAAGSADLTLTVNGTSEVLTGAVTGGAPDRIRFAAAASGTTYFLDAVVPEPTSIVLMLGVGLGAFFIQGKRACGNHR